MNSKPPHIVSRIRERFGTNAVVRFQRAWLWLGWLAFGVFGVRFVLHFLPPLQTVSLFLTVLAFCLPGWILLSLLWGGEHATRRPELWLWGGVLGLLLGIWLGAVEGYVTGVARGFSVLALDAVAMTAWFVFTRRSGFDPVRIREWTFGERALWQLVSLWMLVYFSRAFLPFEYIAANGFTVYPAAIAVDVFREVSLCTSLSLGLPPESLALAGVAAPLEAGIALFPVIGRTWMDPSGAMIGWTVVSHFLVALAFAGVVVTILRAFVTPLRSLVVAAFVVFFAGSLYWVYPVFRPDLIGASIADSPDAAAWTARLVGPLVHRWILTQPQIALTVTVAFVTVAWFRSRPLPPSWPHLAALGVLAGIVAGIDYYAGWIGVVLAVGWIGALWIEYPNDRSRLGLGLLSCGAGVTAAILPIWWLGVQSPYVLSDLTFAAPEGGAISFAAKLVIAFGLLLVLGIWGLVGTRVIRGRAQAFFTWGVLVLAIVLLAGVQSSSDSLFGIRSGMLLLFVLVTVGTARLLADRFPFPPRQNLIFLAALMLAVPTTITDYYYAGLVSDAPHQLMVHPEDETAANWARKYLPPGAVVQSDPDYRTDVAGASPVQMPFSWGSSLAQRAMIAGATALAPSVHRGVAQQRQAQVRAMLDARRPDSLHGRAVDLGVGYLYVGPSEMRRYPRLRTRLMTSRDLFAPVYESDSAAIFEVYPLAP